MKNITTMMTLLLCTMCLAKANAVTIYECVDEAGNSTFQDHCPPGTTPANERDIKTGAAGEETEETAAPAAAAETPAAGGPITFYTTSTECDACLVIKSTLDKYGASYTEKDISTDLASRQELKDRTGASGSVSVPTVIIGEQVISGFNKEALSSALESAGYARPAAPAAVTPPGQRAAPAPGTEPVTETEEETATEETAVTETGETAEVTEESE